jgi:exosortase
VLSSTLAQWCMALSSEVHSVDLPCETATTGPTHPAVARRSRIAVLCLLAVLVVACYFPMLQVTGKFLAFSDDMAYGFFAPIIALYIAWSKRSVLLNPQSTGSAWSIAFLSFGALIASVATLASSSTFSRIGFLFTLAGCLLLVGGRAALRGMVFPLALLLFTFPLPDVLYGEMTQPLQLLASRLSESALELLGFSVIREGNILQLIHLRLSVVEACSGLRSLITLFFFCIIYAYFFETKLWVRIGVVLLAIPSAIAVNAMRITATGVMGTHNVEWTEGVYHEMVGWTAFCVGFLLVLAAHKSVRRFALRSEGYRAA